MTTAVRTANQMGALLLSRRQTLGLSQQDVASRLGISQNRLSELEQKPGRLTLDRLLATAHLLGFELVLRPTEKNQPTTEW